MEPLLDSLEHISEKPWSSYSESNYSLQQWHNACLIHQHDGAPTSKSQCKIPVKTPNGALNRNGVHAAAAALAGARGGVNASSDEKASAARSLVRYYGQLNEQPPLSITNLAHGVFIENFLDHHGIKGMHWGVRRGRGSKPKSDRTKTTFQKGPVKLTDAELKRRIGRMEMEKRYNDLNSKDVTPGAQLASRILKDTGSMVIGTLLGGTALFLAKKGIEKKFGPDVARGILPKVKGAGELVPQALEVRKLLS
jgi:hypothetical protein